MTASAYEQPTCDTTVVGQLATCTGDLASLVGGGCLVEDRTGRVVAQRLAGAAVAPAVLTCLLEGTARALRAGLGRPRATALLPSGPVVESVLRDGGDRVIQITLVAGGSVWLLPSDAQPLDLDRALPALRRLDEL